MLRIYRFITIACLGAIISACFVIHWPAAITWVAGLLFIRSAAKILLIPSMMQIRRIAPEHTAGLWTATAMSFVPTAAWAVLTVILLIFLGGRP